MWQDIIGLSGEKLIIVNRPQSQHPNNLFKSIE